VSTAAADPSAPLRAAARHGVLGLVVLAVVAAVVGGLAAGAPGVWGALLGAAVCGAFVLFTVAVVLGTAGSAPTTTAAVLMGTWLLKLVVLIVALAVLRRFDFYDSTTFGVVVIVGVVVLLGLETLAVVRTRNTYVDPVPSISDSE
jgi:hypothetical protein